MDYIWSWIAPIFISALLSLVLLLVIVIILYRMEGRMKCYLRR